MAASILEWENGWPVSKPWIKVALSENIGKQFKIATGSHTGSVCTPVHVMFSTKHDTRMLCRIEGTEIHELFQCNELIRLPIEQSPLPKCTMKVAPLTLDEVRSYLNCIIRYCDKKPAIWARRDMIKRMLRDDNFCIPCNYLPPFNNSKFHKSRIIDHQTAIKLRSACPFGGYVDFTKFSEGICTNNRCFHCSFGEWYWHTTKRSKIYAKFHAFLDNGYCNSCYYVHEKNDLKQMYGGHVKYAAHVLDSRRAKSVLAESNIPKDNEDSAWATSDEEATNDYDSVSSIDSDSDHLEFWDESVPEPKLSSQSMFVV